MSEKNVLGAELEACGLDPVTGFYRDGSCSTGPQDLGSHTICAVVTAEFLAHQQRIGNDLSTPIPEYRFPGLVPGDRWCVTARNWLQSALRRRRSSRLPRLNARECAGDRSAHHSGGARRRRTARPWLPALGVRGGDCRRQVRGESVLSFVNILGEPRIRDIHLAETRVNLRSAFVVPP